MLNRWIGILSLLFMLSVNGALVWKVYLPQWLAGAPPKTDAELLRSGQERRVQHGIFGPGGYEVGRGWTVAHKYGQTLDFRSLVVIEHLRLPHNLGHTVPLPLSLEMRITYETPAYPDQLEIQFRGLPMPLIVRGEYFSGDFPCEWKLGQMEGAFLLDSQQISTLGDVIRPFDRLPGLYEGMSWEVRLFDPLSQVLPGLGWRPSVEAILVHVTRSEVIKHPHTGADVEVFVVEAPEARAWVAHDGRVLLQEVDLPIVGTLTLVDEPFDEASYEQAVLDSWQNEE